MELKDTVDLMLSSDYKKRFRAEVIQLAVRVQKLQDMLKRWEQGTLDFEPKCPKELLENQLKAMSEYLCVLRIRAGIEDVDIFGSGDLQ